MPPKKTVPIADYEREALRSAMAELGISQSEAARQLGCSQFCVHSWLHGKSPLSEKNAERLKSVISTKLAVTFTTGQAVEARLRQALSWSTKPGTPATKRRTKGD